MQWPLILTDGFSHSVEMVVAVVIGTAFGFVLERAGFGTAKNLTSIFYGRDFLVMRVMFTAIVVAMIGLYFLDLAGIMPIGNIGLLPTYLMPQFVGGVMLGFGFIIGGYCPGTSLVAAASGKVDAAIFVGGLFIGATGFTLFFDFIADWHKSGSMGRILLHEYFGVPSAVMVPVVVLFAVGGFFMVGRIEGLVRERLAEKGVDL